MWDEYLEATVEVKQQELPLDNAPDADQLSSKDHREAWDLLNGCEQSQSALFQQALKLPCKIQRKILKLRFLENLNNCQIARAMKINRNRVSKEAQKALATIKGNLEEAS